jgi:hypothetical protein
MTTRRANLVVALVFGGFIFFRILYPPLPEDTLSNTLVNLSIELVGGILLFNIIHALQHVNHFWFFIQTRILLRTKDVRLSIAYLFRIKVNGRYLLVKSRTRNYFQPVGGAFKTLPGSEVIFDKLGVKPDRLIETEKGIAKRDLRVFVKGIHVIEFLEWFDSRTDRETSPWREFCEELIFTAIVPWKEFRHIDYKFKGVVQSPIINLDSGDKGIFRFEIYDLLPNDEQRGILETLEHTGNTGDYIWADEYLINRLGHDERDKQYNYEIAPHAKHALHVRWMK